MEAGLFVTILAVASDKARRAFDEIERDCDIDRAVTLACEARDICNTLIEDAYRSGQYDYIEPVNIVLDSAFRVLSLAKLGMSEEEAEEIGPTDGDWVWQGNEEEDW